MAKVRERESADGRDDGIRAAHVFLVRRRVERVAPEPCHGRRPRFISQMRRGVATARHALHEEAALGRLARDRGADEAGTAEDHEPLGRVGCRHGETDTNAQLCADVCSARVGG